ncbi:hypothetical protein RA991_22665, partial [Mycobacteroides abscessus subsp. massiliense]
WSRGLASAPPNTSSSHRSAPYGCAKATAPIYRPVDLDAALSIDDTAAAIAATDTDDARLRLFFEFLRGSDAAGLAALLLVGQEPRTTGDPRFDAL